MTDTTATEAPEVRVVDDDPAAPHLAPLADPTAYSVPALIAEAKAGFLPVPLDQIDAVADRLAIAAKTIRPQFSDNRDACWVVAYQAGRWGMDPVAVLSKSYVTGDSKKGGIGYEAQLIHALINRFAPIEPGGMRFIYGYGGDGKPTAKNRFVRVEARDIRTGEVKHITTPTVAQIGVKNSPLWFSDTDQQLAYYGGRAFGRRHYPEVLLGVYSVDEVHQIEIRDLTAPRSRPLFEEEDEPQDAEFEGVPQSETDAANYERWAKKASGEQDSRDPRDAPQNAQGQEPPKNGRTANSRASGPTPPPGGENEPEDAPQLREWASQQQTAILAMSNDAQAAEAWRVVIADKRWDRFRTYQADLAKAIKASVFAHVEKLQKAKAAGADPSTGEV